MKHKNYRILLGACAAVSAMLLVAGAYADDSALPPLQHVGDLSYLSGGIGVDESSAMKAEAGTYALALTFAARIGDRDAYTSDVQLTIAKADGASLLDIKSAGPYLLVNLPAGKYRITAIFGEISKTQLVQIATGAHRQLVFEWVKAGQA